MWKMGTIDLVLLMLLFQHHEIETTLGSRKFNFYKPQRSSYPRSDNVQYLVAETSKKFEIKCNEGELRSPFVERKIEKRINSPFVAQPSSAGKYECSATTIHLVVVDPLNFTVISKADTEDRTELHCAAAVYTGGKSLFLTLNIYDSFGRILETKSLTTRRETSKLDLIAKAEKQQKILFSLEDLNSFSCLVTVFEPSKNKTIFRNKKHIVIKLYSPLRNVRPNATKAAPGQAICCLSDGVPPAHRYTWKYYDIHRDSQLQKPFFISSGHILKIFDEGNHSFVCTAFNVMGKREYGLSWVGNLFVVGERKVEARSIGKWVAGGLFTTVVVLVAVVSYAKS